MLRLWIPMSSEIICFQFRHFATPLRDWLENHHSRAVSLKTHIFDQTIIAARPIRQIFGGIPDGPTDAAIRSDSIHPTHEHISDATIYEAHLLTRYRHRIVMP